MTNRESFLPLWVILIFNIFTLFLYFTAPIIWNTPNNLVLFLYLIINYIFIALGYIQGLKIKNKISITPSLKSISTFISIFYFFTFYIRYCYLLKTDPFQIGELFEKVAIGLVAPEIGYKQTLDRSLKQSIPWTVFFLISIVNQMYFLNGFVNWKKFDLKLKFPFIFFVLLEVIYWFSRGTNFGIITLILTYLLSLFINLNIDKFKLSKVLIYTVIFFLLTLLIFSYNLFSRSGLGSNSLNLENFTISNNNVVSDSIIFEILPDWFINTYLLTLSYFAQGYYHLSLAFDLEYNWCYWFGSNPALIDFGKIIGIDVFQNTYIYQLEKMGVDSYISWHSAFLWFANDFTFWGVPIVLYLISYFTAKSWILARIKGNLSSKFVFIILMNILIFLFANNTYLSSVFYSLMFMFPYWFFRQRKHLFNFK